MNGIHYYSNKSHFAECSKDLLLAILFNEIIWGNFFLNLQPFALHISHLRDYDAKFININAFARIELLNTIKCHFFLL